MRVGLVLGAGGVLGGAWLLGALQGLKAATGWQPADAELVVGTSAGALVGGLVAARRWPQAEPVPTEVLVALHDASRRVIGRPPRPAVPGSPALVATGWRARPRSLAWMMAGLAPRGLISTGPIRDFVRRTLPEAWPIRPRLWIVATDYLTGEPVVFGRTDAPPAALSDAVAASCAVPGFYAPVRIDGRLLVDGAVGSGPGLRLAAGLGLDLVVCLNPGSSAADPGAGFRSRLRGALHRELLGQLRLVEAQGTRVATIEPDDRLSRLIGINPMRRRTSAKVSLEAAASVARDLGSLPLGRELAELAAAPLPR
jgi:NTE family protein